MAYIDEYKQTRSEIRAYVKQLKHEMKELSNPDRMVSDYREYIQAYLELEARIRNMKAMINNLTYVIKWLESGHEPNNYGAVDNLKATEKYL